MDEPPAGVVTFWAGRSLTARLHGVVDFATAEDLADRLRPDVASADATRLDLRGVEFIDSAGIRMLFDLLRTAEARGRRFTVSVPEDGPVPYVLRVCAFPQEVIESGEG